MSQATRLAHRAHDSRRVIEVRQRHVPPLEIVERKGRGHPDSICDALAEELSIALSKVYLAQAGVVLHHNVDKVLLRGGASRPALGGGEVLEPIDIYMAGRATRRAGGSEFPIRDIVHATALTWLGAKLRHLDPHRHVRIHDLVREGSTDLVGLFERRRESEAPLANDTSIGVGFAPATPLERIVLAVETELNAEAMHRAHPAFGEDVKVMGVRSGSQIELTVACAQVDRHVATAGDYAASISALRTRVAEIAERTAQPCVVHVNTGDAIERGQLYLTVTGTSAEAGDDGEVGRGNRVGGLITPHRPMTMEAAAGKNAISHVGKIYNVLAREMASEIVQKVEGVVAAEVWLASQIGRPIDDPHAVHVVVEVERGKGGEALRAAVDAMVDECLPRARGLWRGFLERAYPVF
ncbi:MAG: methionine adenosyltransferase [Planctomycetota bacterium]